MREEGAAHGTARKKANGEDHVNIYAESSEITRGSDKRERLIASKTNKQYLVLIIS